MSNPYESPTEASTEQDDKISVPISAYIMAVISAVFVFFGVFFIFAFSPLYFGPWMESVPSPVLLLIYPVALGLAILSAWQTISQAKQSEIDKRQKS